MMNARSADADRDGRLVALVEHNVTTELQVINGSLSLGLDDMAINSLMQGVVSGLLCAFEVDWSPDWVRPGQIHHWQETGKFFARCAVCLKDSPPSPDESTAVTWARRHEASHES